MCKNGTSIACRPLVPLSYQHRLVEMPELKFDVVVGLCPVCLWQMLRIEGWGISLAEVRDLPASPYPDDYQIIGEMMSAAIMRLVHAHIDANRANDTPECRDFSFRRIDTEAS